MRIITRGDLDGLTSSVLLNMMEHIDGVAFAHPKSMQDGLVEVTNQDIIINLPYHPNCALWFDHHSTPGKAPEVKDFEGRYEVAPSCARVVYNYYGQPSEFDKFQELLKETDRVDSANLTMEDVLNPKGWVLLSYTLDPRTGLGEFRDYFLKLMGWIRVYSMEEILNFPEVKERCDKILQEHENFKQSLLKYSKMEGNAVVTDIRGIENFPVGNRFLIYTLFPNCNISVRIFDGKNKEFIVIAIGHNIFNKTSKTDVGQLCGQFGGGGHRGAGTCQIKPHLANDVIDIIVDRIKSDG